MKTLLRVFLWILLLGASFTLLLDIGLLMNWWRTGEPVHPQLLQHWPWNLVIVGVLIYNLWKSYKK